MRSSSGPTLLALTLGGLFLARVLLAGVGSAPALPRPTGSHAVGRCLLYVLDSTRVDPQAVRADGRREYMVQVWYPAKTPPRAFARSSWIPAAWADSAESDLLALSRRAMARPSIDEVRHAVAVARCWSEESAPVATEGAPFPVLVFSPGNFTLPAYYATLAEEMASWGYVVIGHVPTGYSRNVELPDGRVFPRRSYPDLGPWLGDVRDILEHLSAWNGAPGHALRGCLDLSRVGLYGHSGGANVAEMVAASDDRVRAIAALDPGVTPESCATAKPTLLLVSDLRGFSATHPQDAADISRERTAFLRRLQHGHEISILGSEHMSFTDLSAIPELRTASESSEQLVAMRRVLLGFFEEAMRGIPSPLFRAEAVGDSLIRINRE